MLLPVLLILAFTGSVQAAGDTVLVGYGGVYLAGGRQSEKAFPIYARNKRKVNAALRGALERLQEHELLPFRLVFTTDSETRKREIGDTYSLALVVTRDDVSSDSYQTSIARVSKTVVNVGLVVILYQTTEDFHGRKRNVVVFSTPLVGYSQNLQAERVLTPEEIDDSFISTATRTLEEHLAKRLTRISLSRITGKVYSTDGTSARIKIGAVDGLDSGQKVSFLRSGMKVATGRVERLGRKDADIVVESRGFEAEEGMQVSALNIRGLSGETYQVTGCTVSSKRLDKSFPAERICPQVAQWFSDFLSDRGGKVVLPSRIGGQWDISSTEAVSMVLMQDGQEHSFEMAPPRHPVSLDLTGVSSKMMDRSDINEIWMYKAWLKVDVPSREYSRETDLVTTKNVVTGIQTFQEQDQFYDLLHQLTAKAASKESL